LIDFKSRGNFVYAAVAKAMLRSNFEVFMIIECQKPNEIVKICASAKLAKESKYQKIVIVVGDLRNDSRFRRIK